MQLMLPTRLYDETYKIISDWIFFVRTIGLNGVEVKYINEIVAYYRRDGISSVNLDLVNKEHERARNEIYPLSIKKDYEYFDNQIKSLILMDKISQYRLSYMAVRFIGKFVTVFNMLFKK